MQTVHRVTTSSTYKTNLGVSDLSGMSVSSIFVLLSETDQQNYLHASMRHNVQKSIYEMQSSMKSRVLTDSFQCWPEMAFF